MRSLVVLILLSSWVMGAVTGVGQEVVRRVRNPEAIRKQYGLDKFPFNPRLTKQRIAFIEYGYGAINRENIAKYLPPNAKIINMADKDPMNPEVPAPPAPGLDPAAAAPAPAAAKKNSNSDVFSEHGQYMVQTHYDLIGHPADGPQYFLFISSNTLEFQKALDLMSTLDLDIVANTTNWEYNKYRAVQDLVEEFIENTGVIWINPVPDTGGRVFSSQIPLDAKNDDFLSFNGRTGLRFKARRDIVIDVIMTWDVSRQESTNGSEKDLDIFLYDEDDKPVMGPDGKTPVQGSLDQVNLDPGEQTQPGQTRTAREAFRVNIPLNKKADGYYKLFILKKGGEFRKGQFVKVTINSMRDLTTDEESNQPTDPIDFIDANDVDELGVPSNSPLVIAVADSSHVSARTTRVTGVSKPDVILMQGPIRFTDDTASKWASNAGGAVFPAIVSILLSHNPNLTREDILTFATGVKTVQGVPVKSKASSTNTTTATKLATDLVVVPLKEVKDRYKYVVDAMALAHKTGETRLLFGGKHTTANYYAVGIDQSLPDFLRDLEAFAAKRHLGWRIDFQAPEGFFERRPQNFEMFLRYTSFPFNQQLTETGLVVYLKEGNGKYPWQINGENANQYVEVRQAVTATTSTPVDTNTTTNATQLSTTRTLNQVWVPPTPEQIQNLR